MSNSPKKSRKGGADAKFFQTTKKGEVHELKGELNSTDRAVVKDAVKKVCVLWGGIGALLLYCCMNHEE